MKTLEELIKHIIPKYCIDKPNPNWKEHLKSMSSTDDYLRSEPRSHDDIKLEDGTYIDQDDLDYILYDFANKQTKRDKQTEQQFIDDHFAIIHIK